MHRKMIAIVLVIVITAVSTACGRGGTEKNTGKKHGVRVYMTVTEDGVVTKERRLIKEYEDRGTEKTITGYDDDGNVDELTKSYFDDSGEHLLKQVIWERNYPTYSYEYDRAGRLISECQKNENPDEELITDLRIPSEVLRPIKKQFLYLDFSVLPNKNVTELKTEYSYFEDSDRLKTIKTVTEDGSVVVSFEMGEEDIVISGFLENYKGRYEETYDPGTNTGTWKYLTSSGKSQFGVKQYDSSGRCVSYTIYDETPQYLLYETSVTYDAEGAHAVTKRYDRNSEKGTSLYKLIERVYDKDGLETYLLDMWYDENGNVTDGDAKYRTYHKNGKTATVKAESWNEQTQAMKKDYETCYDEDGECTDTYIYGNVPYEKHIRQIDYPGVSGKVRCNTVTHHSDGSDNYSFNTRVEEQYEVCMTNEYGAEKWYRFLEVVTTDGEKLEYSFGTFDSDGRLITAKAEFSNMVEFDQQGRISRKKEDAWDGTVEVTEYEYWEDESENP